MQGDTVKNRSGVCSFCQSSGLTLIYDDDDDSIVRLDYHQAFGKSCEGSYSIPETTYDLGQEAEEEERYNGYRPGLDGGQW